MDYQTALKRIEEGSNYWKPKPGQYKVKALSELEEAEPFTREKEGVKEVTAQFKIKLLVSDEQKIWTFGMGATKASTYGQLVELAANNNNTLLNKEFTVAVKNDGTKNDYTIVG